jgi:hypothetical protein
MVSPQTQAGLKVGVENSVSHCSSRCRQERGRARSLGGADLAGIARASTFSASITKCGDNWLSLKISESALISLCSVCPWESGPSMILAHNNGCFDQYGMGLPVVVGLFVSIF